jgi:asperthecin polyketide synthase
MNVTELQVLHAQVISDAVGATHLIKIIADIDLSTTLATKISWFSLGSDHPEEAFAECVVRYEDPTVWQQEWRRLTHLIHGRAQELSRLVGEGEGTRADRRMAYTLFRNVVDYTDKYQGIQSVVLNGFEAVAEVKLAPEEHGVWHSAPHFVDSVFHAGGLVLNAGGAVDAKDNFYVTPGWGAYRLSRRLRPGDRYTCYVHMVPQKEVNIFAGDVYVMQAGEIVGMMTDMRFRRVSRVLMDRFFSPRHNTPSAKSNNDSQIKRVQEASVPIPRVVDAARVSVPISSPLPTISLEPASISVPHRSGHPKPPVPEVREPASTSTDTVMNPAQTNTTEEGGVIADCLRLISRESGLELSKLTDDASFVELGVDSLMSLVLSEKFHSELQVEVKSSVFLECANVGALKDWLKEYA